MQKAIILKNIDKRVRQCKVGIWIKFKIYFNC